MKSLTTSECDSPYLSTSVAYTDNQRVAQTYIVKHERVIAMRLSLICEDVGKTALARKAISAAVEKGQLAVHSEADLLRAVQALINSDPTPDKTYLMWLVKMYINGHIAIDGLPPRPVGLPPANPIALPASQSKIIQTLGLFSEATPRLEPNDRNIFAFPDFDALTGMLETYVQSGRIKAKASVRKMPGTRIIYNKNRVVVYAIGRTHVDNTDLVLLVDRRTPIKGISPENMTLLSQTSKPVRKMIKDILGADSDIAANSMAALGMGPPESKWCTRTDYNKGQGCQAKHYLSKGNNFIIYKDGEPLIQQTYVGGALSSSQDINNQPASIAALLPELASEIQSVINTADSTLINIFNSRVKAAIETAIAANPDSKTLIFANAAQMLAYINSDAAVSASGMRPKELIESLPPNRPFVIHGKGNVITCSKYEIKDEDPERNPYGSGPFKPYVNLYDAVGADGYRFGKTPRGSYQSYISINLENLVIYDNQTGQFDKPQYPNSHRHICMVKLPSGEITSMDG